MSADPALLERASKIVAAFETGGAATDAQPYAGGHIHDTFLVTAGGRRWIVQRLNTSVFPHPEHVMENIAAVGDHLERMLRREGVPDFERRVLRAAPAHDGTWLARDGRGDRWRVLVYIEGTTTMTVAVDAQAAGAAAMAFGRFQRRLAEYEGPPLHTTIEHFHDTPRRYAGFHAAVRADPYQRARGAAAEIAFAEAHRPTASLLVNAQQRGEIREAIAHHDAKISNVLFDRVTGEAMCVVDLDTVMPGLTLYDFGDLVRSMASVAAEDDPDPRRAAAVPERLAAIVRGYLEGVAETITAAEERLLPAAAKVITLEQGIRFLTDHLEGDGYYRADRPGHNLDRCRTQFALLASLEELGADLARRVAP